MDPPIYFLKQKKMFESLQTERSDVVLLDTSWYITGLKYLSYEINLPV